MSEIERRLAARLYRSTKQVETIVTRRKAVITAVNAGPPKTVDVDFEGTAVLGVSYLYNNGWVPQVDDNVLLEITLGGDPLVVDRYA